MEAKRETVALFLAALTARLGTEAYQGLSSIRFGDSLAYIGAANRLLREGTYPANTDGLFFRPPGYPVFLALSTAGHPEWVVLDKLWNAVLGAAGVVILAAIARRVFESRPITVAVGGLAALHPPFLYLGSEVQSEPLYLLLALAAGFFLLVCADRPSSGMGLLAGGTLALAALTRPSALALSLVLAAPFFDRRYPKRVRRELAVSAFLGFVLVLAPWATRNAIKFHALLPVNDAGGFAFYQGNSDWNVRYYRLHSPAEYERWIDDLNAAVRTRWTGEIPGLADANPARRSAAFLRASLGWIRGHPRAEAWLLWKKAAEWMRPGASPLVRSNGVVVLTTGYYGLLFLFAAAGIASARRRGIAIACVSIAAITMAAHVVFIVVLRYRMASWDPILILYAPSGALRLFRGLRG